MNNMPEVVKVNQNTKDNQNTKGNQTKNSIDSKKDKIPQVVNSPKNILIDTKGQEVSNLNKLINIKFYLNIYK